MKLLKTFELFFPGSNQRGYLGGSKRKQILKSESSKLDFWEARREDDVHKNLQGMAKGRRGGESWKGVRF